ncbi:UvrD-helicase domain-containing protein [Rhodococcus pyridinivorans]|uniref:UvrD-helicase domain-containing protein n=1 Tax=Rhodococcus pyridinivorans TaxID=103816 RepID=UPI00200AB894|nr:UvrD-helicase domain-containing protein [Rhodococcus pyridinivorans]UPW03764.1 UvrD-helicase domain-containing protein [Rhodococcus pyridinivorans]
MPDTAITDPRAAGGPPPADFDLLGRLPSGTTVLEASAGTGKTYAIVGLATRFVAEGRAHLSDLLLVTFSRAATQELRERTRNRFAQVATALADPESARASTDMLVRHLASEDVDARRARLRQALSDFDSGTISTTHGFCRRMLDELGIAGEREPDVTVVEDVDDLRVEVVDDLYLRRYGRGQAPITYAEAAVAAKEAIFDPQAELAPNDADGTAAGERVEFARAVREEVERRKRRLGLRDFDDQLSLLHAVLGDPEHGDAACRRMRARFSVVLVDEFQDTDPKQWEILRRAFHGHSTLVLVGDPKQAIYAFRGAEVLSYLDAVSESDTYCELTTNWRSDGDLVRALEHVHLGAALGDPRIVVNPVKAAAADSRLSGIASLRVRHLPRAGAGPLNDWGFPQNLDGLRGRVARDVAADIVRLLDDENVTVDLGSGPERVQPGHIAVLVRKHKQVTLVHDALTKANVPCVVAGGTSVFATPSAQHWLWVLYALEQPHRADRVRLAALTPLLGRTMTDIDSEGEALVVEVGGLLRELNDVYARTGFAAVFERLASFGSVEARLLDQPSGERTLTDIRHVAQLLEDVASAQSLGLAALTRWLEDRINDPDRGGADRIRRLDSDAAAVQILTVHGSKGLEFPVVHVPYGWDAAKNPEPDKLLLHENGRRILDVGGKSGPGYVARRRQHELEEAGEELRLLYVAVTRAQCALTLWWAPSTPTSRSPLHRLLFARDPGSAEVSAEGRIGHDEAMAEEFDRWAARADGVIAAEAVGPHPIPVLRWTRPRVETGPLAAARFDRVVDENWRRTSYSALTASVHDAPVVSGEVEEPVTTDEPAEPPLSAPEAAREGIPSPMNGLPGGTIFGTLVHAVLEVVDTSAADLEAELLDCCHETVRRQMSPIDPVQLAAALLPVMRTPLGPLGRTLADFTPSDRLSELDFELPLTGGDSPVPVTVTLDAVGGLLRRHLPADDPMATYADLVRTLESVPLRGYLNGSIDAVLRTDGPRFVVVDYKTNRLAPVDELTTAHYTRESMAAEMLRAHYPMQALLYSVALHRYLRWRMRDYDPHVHLGGVQYLFVRGMAGPDSPPGSGVFDWHPPADLVTDLSDLLAGKAMIS